MNLSLLLFDIQPHGMSILYKPINSHQIHDVQSLPFRFNKFIKSGTIMFPIFRVKPLMLFNMGKDEEVESVGHEFAKLSKFVCHDNIFSRLAGDTNVHDNSDLLGLTFNNCVKISERKEDFVNIS